MIHVKRQTYAQLYQFYKINDVNGFIGLYKSLRNKDIKIYNLIMKMYKNNKRYRDGIKIYNSIDDELKDEETHTCAMEIYSKLKDINNCIKILERNGIRNERVLNGMLNAYNDHKMYHEAIDLFLSKDMEVCKSNRNCNAAIQAYSKLNDMDNCEKIFNSVVDKDKSVYGTMMHAYNDNKMYHKTVELFSSKEMETFKDAVNCNIAIQAYSKLNDIPKCEEIFDSINDKNSVVYNCMMQVYNEHQLYQKSVEIYSLESMQKCQTNMTANMAIQAYSHLNDIGNCEKIFQRILYKNKAIYGSMMQAYIENKMYHKAVELFWSKEMVKFKDIMHCNMLIQALSKLGDVCNCEIVFNSLRDKTIVIYNTMLQAYNDNKLYHKTIELFESEEMRISKNNISGTIAIQAYSNLNDLDNCIKIFDSIMIKNDVVFNCMLKAYNDNKMYTKTIELFSSDKMEKFKDNISHSFAIHAYSKLNDIHNAEIAFDSVMFKNELIYGSMMQCYNKNEMYYKTIELFLSYGAQKLNNNVLCNICMQAYSKLNRISDCEAIFDSIVNKDEAIYGTMMQAYIDNKMYEKTVELFLSNDIEVYKNDIIRLIAIQAYSKLNDIQNCEIVFGDIENKDLNAYSFIMNAYRLNGEHKKLLNMFDELLGKYGRLDAPIFCNALNCCGDMVSLEKGQYIVHKLNHKNNRHLISNSYILAAIISLHGKCNDNLIETRKLYDLVVKMKFIRDDTHMDIIHKSMIDCYSKSGDIDNIVHLFEEIKRKDTTISDSIYSMILNCCSHAGNTEKAIEIFNEYIEYNNILNKTYILTSMIDCLARNNKLDEAERYYNKYGTKCTYYKDKIVMLTSILSSCKTYNDINRAHSIVNNIESLYQINNDSNMDTSIYLVLNHLNNTQTHDKYSKSI